MHKASVPKNQKKAAIVIIASDDEDDIIYPPRLNISTKGAIPQNEVISIDLTLDDDELFPPTKITPLPSSRIPKHSMPNKPQATKSASVLPAESTPISLPKSPSMPKSPLPQKDTSTLLHRSIPSSSQRSNTSIPHTYSKGSPQRPIPSSPITSSSKRPTTTNLSNLPTSPQRLTTFLPSQRLSPSISPPRPTYTSLLEVKPSDSSTMKSSSSSLIPPISETLHSPDKRLSLPRSALISKSTTTPQVRKPSSIVKAASPVRRPAINTSLKRPIDLPEWPSPKSIINRSLSSSQKIHGSPKRPSSQSIFRSPVCTPPVNHKRFKESLSPFSKPPVFNKKPVIYGIHDEDGKEEDLDIFVSAIQGTIRTVKVDNISKPLHVQCPLCKYLIPREELEIHASECTGEIDNHVIQGPKADNKRVIRKKTIADAIKLDESERKKLNKGKIDLEPTNYYADSESILALDGVGFNSEATGMSWESAGQTRFG